MCGQDSDRKALCSTRWFTACAAWLSNFPAFSNPCYFLCVFVCRVMRVWVTCTCLCVYVCSRECMHICAHGDQRLTLGVFYDPLLHIWARVFPWTYSSSIWLCCLANELLRSACPSTLSWGYGRAATPDFNMGAGSPNSDPHTYTAISPDFKSAFINEITWNTITHIHFYIISVNFWTATESHGWQSLKYLLSGALEKELLTGLNLGCIVM